MLASGCFKLPISIPVFMLMPILGQLVLSATESLTILSTSLADANKGLNSRHNTNIRLCLFWQLNDFMGATVANIF